MKTILPLYLFSLLLLSCSQDQPKAKNKLNISNEGFEFVLFQRKEIELPSDSGNVFCYIDDITGGQTQLKIRAGEKVILDDYFTDGKKVEFNFNDGKYFIECKELINKLLGEDYGRFKVLNRSMKVKNSVNETAQIEKLLDKIESSQIIFIRNGTEYSSQEAADHLRSKWMEAKDEVKTLDDFIVNIASTSSMSGKPYLVKLKDGKVMTAEAWYKTQN